MKLSVKAEKEECIALVEFLATAQGQRLVTPSGFTLQHWSTHYTAEGEMEVTLDFFKLKRLP